MSRQTFKADETYDLEIEAPRSSKLELLIHLVPGTGNPVLTERIDVEDLAKLVFGGSLDESLTRMVVDHGRDLSESDNEQ